MRSRSFVAEDVGALRRAPFEAPGLAFEQAVDDEAVMAAHALEPEAAPMRPLCDRGQGRDQSPCLANNAFDGPEHSGRPIH